MNGKKEMPVVVNDWQESLDNRAANRMIKLYETEVYPILFRLGLLDDEHIKKYLGCSSMEDIYKDALLKDKKKLLYLERESFFNGTDLWEPFRDKKSPVNSPSEIGFIFRKLPGSDYGRKRSIARAMLVENGKITLDKEAIAKMCIITPTEKQRKIYEITANFCEEIGKIDSRITPFSLLMTSKKGTLCPLSN